MKVRKRETYNTKERQTKREKIKGDGVLQCVVALRCSALQCDAVCCSVLQCVTMCFSVLQCVAVRRSVLQCVPVCCSTLQCVAVRCSTLQCVAVCCKVLQRVHQSTRLNQRLFEHVTVSITSTIVPAEIRVSLKDGSFVQVGEDP